MSNDHELPPGYRFYPTEEELVSFYLRKKLEKIREDDIERVIPTANIYCLDPWQLPEISGEPCNLRDSEQWFFFCPRQEREAHGGRPTRTTPSGYWKATGTTGPVYSSTNRARVIGLKKAMVFYMGRAPNGTKTKWKMNEYKALDEAEAIIPFSAPKLRNEITLCRVYKNSGCMRAYDRRPSIAAMTSENSRVQEALMNNSQNHSGTKRARSEDSSSTDENGCNPASRQGETVDLKMLEEFDWNQLDWI